MSEVEVQAKKGPVLKVLDLASFLDMADDPVAICIKRRYYGYGLYADYFIATARWKDDKNVIVMYEELVYDVLARGTDEEKKERAKKRVDELETLINEEHKVVHGEWEV